MDVMRILLWVMLLSAMSCHKVEMSAPPTIVEIFTPSEHGVGYHALAGKINRFYITAADDKALKEVMITLSRSKDFHAHSIHAGSSSPTFKSPNMGVWNPEQMIAVNGDDTTVIFKFSAPNNISGEWDLYVSVLDDDGNISFRHEVVSVMNDSIPAILPVSTSHGANDDGVIELNVHDVFVVEGNILDADYLQSVEAAIYHNGEVIWQHEWIPENTWMFDMTQISIPPFNGSGKYELQIRATDLNGWSNWIRADFSVI